MLSAQNLLPRLPVPKLSDSMQRFLRAVQPLIGQAEFEKTRTVVDDFINSGVGPKLQKHLEQRATMQDNWLNDWWFECAYLGYRDPLMLFSSPAYALPRQAFNNKDDQFRLASGVISAALDYRKMIVDDAMQPEVIGKGRRLCMAQYPRIWDNYRLPQAGVDKMLTRTGQVVGDQSKNVGVTVLYRNGCYNLNVDLTKNDPQAIYNSLITLKKEKSMAKPAPVGILTSWQRDKWSDAYVTLEKLNTEALDSIQKSAFVLCLDSLDPHSDKSITNSINQMLHGGGSSINTCNRWFDKTIQIVVGEDGALGGCLEHTCTEAFPLVALLDFIMAKVNRQPWQNLQAQSQDNGELLKRVEFKTSPEIDKLVETAAHDTDALIGDLDLKVHTYHGFGRVPAKDIGVTADALCQLAFQVAFHRMHQGKLANCYETGSSRRYLLGRTDVIRPCTNEAAALCQYLNSTTTTSPFQGDDKEARKLLATAVKAHQEAMASTLGGKAFDRHLLGLKMISKEKGIELHPLFSTEAYSKLQHFYLSTSQVSCDHDQGVMGYAPLVSDGYGCCYNIRPHCVTFAVSSWRSCPETDSKRFATAISDAMSQLFRLAASNKGPATAASL